jgi:hypothetical protein
MTKLHELLAVQGTANSPNNLNGQVAKLRTELAATFEKKRHLFEETRKTFTPNGEDTLPKIEEQKSIQTTVVKEIEWINKHIAKALDVAYQVDLANRVAAADVLTEDNQTLLKAIPATTLLQLEKRVAEWRDLIATIPTLDPSKSFVPDPTVNRGIYKARDVVKIRTKKGKKVYIKYEATKEHPAQTELIDEDIPIGTLQEQEWSAMITPALKADLLDRVEILLRAVSRARSRANEQEIEVTDKKIGAKLLDYVFQPLLQDQNK